MQALLLTIRVRHVALGGLEKVWLTDCQAWGRMKSGLTRRGLHSIAGRAALAAGAAASQQGCARARAAAAAAARSAAQ